LSSILGYTFSWDRRNDPITPTGGFDVRFSQDLAGAGGDVKYLRTDVRANAYKGLYKNVIASATLSGGYIRGWGGDAVTINDRYFKGNFDFRGYDNAGIGPRLVDVNGETGEVILRRNALGGNAFGLAAAEVSFPVGVPNLLGSIFVGDACGNIADDGNEATFVTCQRSIDSLSLRAMLGASVFWESPFGPIRFDFTKPLRQFDFDDRQSFQFTTRTRF